MTGRPRDAVRGQIRRRWRAAFVGSAVALSLAMFAQSERLRDAFGRPLAPPIENARYDGRFTFTRLRYTTAPGGYYYCGGLPAWAHGYQSCQGGRRAETNLMRIMKDLRYLNPHIADR